MSPGAEGSSSTRTSVVESDAGTTTHSNPATSHHGLDTDQVPPEPPHDRWAWRRKVRANPHRLRFYRVVVGIAGLLLVILGLVSGPLPGPGGIPLVLLGMAVWASEFAWAHRVMLRVKHALHVFRSWSRPKQALTWLVFFAACALFGYTYLLVLGPPFWLPPSISTFVQHLPGV